MPTNPVQIALAAFELTLVFGGAGLLLTILFNPRNRQRWLGTHGLPYWPLSIFEFLLLAALVMLGAFFPGAIAQLLLKEKIAAAADKTGLEVVVYGSSFHGGMLLGILAFFILRDALNTGKRTEMPQLRPGTSLSWPKVLQYAIGTLLVALPIVALVSLGWNYVLRALSLPDTPQDLIAIFAKTKSPFVTAGMLIVACGLAPLAEELVFRKGIYRFCRQNHQASVGFVAAAISVQGMLFLKEAGDSLIAQQLSAGGLKALYAFGTMLTAAGVFWFGSRSRFIEKNKRVVALLLSGVCFGVLHNSWAGALPLAALGMILALAYEATGSIRVPIVVHALFNLNSILIVLSGLSEVAS